MADEDITLDGKPLQSLRVADLKAALEQRNLPKSGQKNTLMKRLKGALMLENLQRSSSTQSVLQPNSQMGEEMCQNSFIKQYLAKQQELLHQRLEREAQKEDDDDDDDDESPAGPEEDDDEDNDSSSDKHQPSRSAVPDLGGGDSSSHHQGALETPRVRVQQATSQQGQGEPPGPSPPRAVASLLVRVVGQPDCQGPPLASPRPQEKEPAGLSRPGPARPVLNRGRSAKSSAGNHIRDDNDDDDSDDEDEDWGPDPGRSGHQKRTPPSLPQLATNTSSAASRSKRKLQPPQHILPPQVDPIPMQLRHPTPPPSPPPNLFPLPDTPKQSPPDDQERQASFQPPSMQRQDSDSSSHSSSPEPHVVRRPGPLSLLVHKMETEEASSARGSSEETAAHSTSGHSGESLPQHGSEKESKMKEKKEREQPQAPEKERRKTPGQEREKKRSGEKKEEKTRLGEERKRRQREEQEKERKRKEEEKKRGEQRVKEEEEKKLKKASDDRMVAETQDSGSSSESGSKSDSSSRSSSSSSRDKSQTVNQLKKADQKQDGEDEKKTNSGKALEKQNLSKREVSEPSTAEVEPASESSVAQQPPSGSEPESSESRMEESTTPKAFAARKISLSCSKASPARTDGAAAEPDTGNAGGRKRRWGSSTAVTVKKPSISITTDSLKSLIPDIKVNQEAVVDIHPEEELYLSGDEEDLDTSRDDPDKGIKIRRTVTQVVPSDSQENGQKNEEEDVEKAEEEKPNRTTLTKDKRKSSLSEEPPGPQISVNLDGETKKVTPSDGLVRRSISQQKSGVSVTIDDPIRSTRQPSPPRGKVSNIIHVTNLVRPFTLLHLKELLNRTGSVMEEGFWIDKIKSHCYVTYATTEESVATRTALHGVRWPASNPKVLSVDYCEQDELDFHKGILKPKKEEEPVAPPVVPQNRLPPLMPERDRDKEQERVRERDRVRERVRERDQGVRDLWAERQREMERREKARGEREWDRDKICEFARPGEDRRRSRSRERERRRRERAKSRERKSDKKEKDEPPAKLLDDLFLKTKAAPCIYWLPLTEEQATRKTLERLEQQKEREQQRVQRHKEQDEALKKLEEKKVERPKGREKDGTTTTASGVAASRGANGDRERERARDREGDKRKDGSLRSKRPSPPGFGGGRRSRSRSNPRERRR